MSRDYHDQIVVDWDGIHPIDEFGHYLDHHTLRLVEPVANEWMDTPMSIRQVAKYHLCHRNAIGLKRKLYWATELTNPYGALEYAVGSGDDFSCFDYAFLGDGRVVLSATVNSETGCFIESAGYKVVPVEEAPSVALGFVDQAVEWCGWNDVRHTVRGWNQDPYYFYRSVFLRCADNPPEFSDNQIRKGGKRITRYCSAISV